MSWTVEIRTNPTTDEKWVAPYNSETGSVSIFGGWVKPVNWWDKFMGRSYEDKVQRAIEHAQWLCEGLNGGL